MSKKGTGGLYNVDTIRIAKALGKREQASETVGRTTNSDFLDFKSAFLGNLSYLKTTLHSVFTGDSVDFDELYGITEELFTTMEVQVDAILYLNAIYTSEYYTIEHCMRVGILAKIFSRWLGFDPTKMKDATITGFLHDIGMLEVPRNIIEKEGSLTSQEFKMIQEHTGRGVLMLINRGVAPFILEAVRSHHERYDGSGYPKGRKKEEISYLTSLISIVDVYDSMTSNRPYHLATCPFEVIDYFEKHMIDKFNPELLYVFLENIPYIYRNSLVKLSTGQKAKVIFINKNHKTSPIVQVEGTGEFIDLSSNRSIKIDGIL